MMLACVHVHTKFSNDVFYSTADVAATCGISARELNALERYTLQLLDYELFITEEQFAQFDHYICKRFFESGRLNEDFPEQVPQQKLSNGLVEDFENTSLQA